jgi:hypothetical protein
MPSAAGTIKFVENKGPLCHPKPTMYESSPKFERIHVTNELLQRLLIHFRQQTK